MPLLFDRYSVNVVALLRHWGTSTEETSQAGASSPSLEARAVPPSIAQWLPYLDALPLKPGTVLAWTEQQVRVCLLVCVHHFIALLSLHSSLSKAHSSLHTYRHSHRSQAFPHSLIHSLTGAVTPRLPTSLQSAVHSPGSGCILRTAAAHHRTGRAGIPSAFFPFRSYIASLLQCSSVDQAAINRPCQINLPCI